MWLLSILLPLMLVFCASPFHHASKAKSKIALAATVAGLLALIGLSTMRDVLPPGMTKTAFETISVLLVPVAGYALWTWGASLFYPIVRNNSLWRAQLETNPIRYIVWRELW